MKLRRIVTWAACLLLLWVLMLLWQQRYFFDIDECLDAGGRWEDKTAECIKN